MAVVLPLLPSDWNDEESEHSEESSSLSGHSIFPIMHLDVALRMRHLIPGLYGVRCCPGRDWVEGGFEHQNEGGWGTALAPPPDIVQDWCDNVHGDGGPCGRWQPDHSQGGWWFSRSCYVVWDSGESFFYRAGDEGCYDLAFDPEGVVWDIAAYRRVEEEFLRTLRRDCPGPLFEHIKACEDGSMGLALADLLAGGLLQGALDRIF